MQTPERVNENPLGISKYWIVGRSANTEDAVRASSEKAATRRIDFCMKHLFTCARNRLSGARAWSEPTRMGRCFYQNVAARLKVPQPRASAVTEVVAASSEMGPCEAAGRPYVRYMARAGSDYRFRWR